MRLLIDRLRAYKPYNLHREERGCSTMLVTRCYTVPDVLSVISRVAITEIGLDS